MKNIWCLVVLIIVSTYGCSINHSYETINQTVPSKGCCPSSLFEISMPKNYMNPRYTYFLGGSVDFYRFYKNERSNSVVYFDNFYLESVINNINIHETYNDSIIKEWFNTQYYYEYLAKCYIGDTSACSYFPPDMKLEGVDTNGLFWKAIRYKWCVYGYQNVPADKVEFYDSLITTNIRETQALSN